MPSPAADRDRHLLRGIVIAAGIAWAVAFVVVGLGFRLQLYGDGAMFSYAVAAQDVWAFHWHNISERLTVYLLCMAPAEGVVALTRNPGGGVFVYGLLLDLMPLIGLLATYVIDRSPVRIVFVFACASTAVVAPLVFGFPTEMWLAHAWFWPALAAAHSAPRGARGNAIVFATLLAMGFSHEGGLVLAAAILFTLMLRGVRDAAFLRVARALAAVIVLWIAVKVLVPPGSYFADVYVRAGLDFFSVELLRSPLTILLVAVIAGYGLLVLVLARFTAAPVYAALIVVAALAVYWLGFDQALHASNRYYMRTALVVLTPLFGIAAALLALEAEGRLLLLRPLVTRVLEIVRGLPRPAFAALFLLVTLVHAVETAKFLSAWTDYKAAVRALAIGAVSDPALGDARFVSSARIAAQLNRLSWFSTTPYLSIILADFTPARLVVDPTSNYFWLSCTTATSNAEAKRAVPPAARELVRVYSCQHR